MTLPPCDPQVYRLAAKLLNDHEHARGFTCYAIREAAFRLKVPMSLCQAQYIAMFGPHKYQVRRDGSFYAVTVGLPGEVYMDQVRRERTEANNHPFWNKSPTPARQQARTIALLLMAEICENPQ